MRPYILTIRQSNGPTKYLHAIARSSADALIGVISELPFGSFVTVKPDDEPRAECVKPGGCNLAQPCSDTAGCWSEEVGRQSQDDHNRDLDAGWPA